MTRIMGKQTGGSEITNEADHFEVCNICKQAYDRRDLQLVMYHLKEGHKPLPEGSRELHLEDLEGLTSARRIAVYPPPTDDLPYIGAVFEPGNKTAVFVLAASEEEATEACWAKARELA